MHAETHASPANATPTSSGSDQLFALIHDTLGFKDAVSNASGIVPGQVFDVYVPSKNFAVEFHNVDWDADDAHADAFVRGAHRKKYVSSKAANVRLIQFYSDEWNNRRSICESVIRNALGANNVQLNGRDCEVKVIDVAQSKPFLEQNHLQGGTRAKHHLGLFHPDHGLVGVMTVRIPIQKKYGNVCELARMALKGGVSVRGGAGKLVAAVKEWAIAQGHEGVISYAELRFGEGNVYEKCGFTLAGETTVNYWYSNKAKRWDRFKYRAQPGKPEKQVVEEAGVKAVWGSGNKIYLMKF